MKRLCFMILISCTGFYLKAQNLVYAEYFFAPDPGIGNGTEIVFTADTVVDFLADIPMTGLSPGFYTLYVRVKDENNNWSLYAERTFHIQSPSGSSSLSPYVTEAEYYFDTDPGVGNGISLSIAADSAIDITVDVPATGFAPGFHIIYLRVKDAGGHWSIYQGRTFHVQEPGSSAQPSPDLLIGEYFFNTDPGIGNGIPFTIPNDSSVNVDIDISVAGLEPGFHTCFVRLQDEEGQWSIYQGRTFHIQSPESSPQSSPEIVAAEYFVDSDPGPGKGTPISIVSGDSLSGIIEADLSGYGLGEYFIYIRFQDANGTWSIYEVDTFSVIDCDVPAIPYT